MSTAMQQSLRKLEPGTTVILFVGNKQYQGEIPPTDKQAENPGLFTLAEGWGYQFFDYAHIQGYSIKRPPASRI